jgi:hypothetical protein
LSCTHFAANQVRLPLHAALAYTLANFLRTLATPEGIDTWSLTPAPVGRRTLQGTFTKF